VDIDGVLVDTRGCREGCDYSGYPERFSQLRREKCPLMKGAPEAIRSLRERGYRVFLHTSRTSRERKVTEKWLAEHDIVYDELHMDKPIGFIYIDDLGYRFGDWDTTLREIFSNPELRCERE